MFRTISFLALTSLAMAGTAITSTVGQTQRSTNPQPTKATIHVSTVAEGLVYPWGLAFLPDGRMLITERSGRLRLVTQDGRLSLPVEGVPRAFAVEQGGLLDVALDPDFASNRLVYISYAEPAEGLAGTAVARGQLNAAATALKDVEVIFRQQPKVTGGYHFGSRLVFAPDGTLFVTLGERFKFMPAQDLSSHLGKIIRINPDGSVPQDNPFVGREDAKPEIWSYGHRNVQGAAIHPETDVLWTNEFGPMGGDELNIPEAGQNYGWPLVSWGQHYNGDDIPDPPTQPDLAQSIYYWNPVISPSGMTFYTGDAFPAWRGDLLIAGLSSQALVRLQLDGQRVTDEQRIAMHDRIRDVKQGPDGLIYLLTDSLQGRVLKVEPAHVSRR